MLRMLISCALIARATGQPKWPPLHLDLGRARVRKAPHELKWTSTRLDSTRRLGINLVKSHNDAANANCIVGGFDEDNPLKIYVGGPCSELPVNSSSSSSSSSSDNFRWIEMESVYTAVVGSDGTVAPFEHVPGLDFIHARETNSFHEVGVGGSQFLSGANPAMTHAAIFSSTTSYLSKETFSYTTNSFVVGENDTMEQCVVACCANPGENGCACANNQCLTQALKAVPGDYKYSIMAASYDFPSIATSAYVAGANGNGWQRVVEEFGEGSPKELENVSMDVYQLIDFTNMKADLLTIIAPDGTAVKYRDMGGCDIDGNAGCDDIYAVASMKVDSDGGKWSGTCVFPQTSNLGSWNKSTVTLELTRKVRIDCVKPTANTLVAWNMAADASAAATLKIVLLRYRFDISGGTAGATSGKWMNYDPTVSTSSPTPFPTGSMSNAPGIFLPPGLFALVVALLGSPFM